MEALTASAIRRADRTSAAIVAAMLLSVGGIGGSLVLIGQASADDASWSPYPSMMLPRAWPETVVLPDGDILVVGGVSISGPTASTEVFDVDEESWKPGPAMAEKRVGHTVTLLDDGTVLVAGGETGSGVTDSAEIIDVDHGACYSLPDMSFSRSGHAAVRLQESGVLVTGGTDWSSGVWSQAEMYDPDSHSWSPAGTMAHARVFLSMQLLESGKAIAIGGDDEGTSELYDPATGEWHGEASMLASRRHSASVVTSSGSVLVAGGVGSGEALASSEMYDSNAGIWLPAGDMNAPRAHFTMSLIPDGRVLAAGSWMNGEGSLKAAELFCQCTMTWNPTTAMIEARGAHGAAELPNGHLLMIGGRDGDVIIASTEEYTPPTTGPEPPPLPPPPYCQPKDILPFILAVAPQMPGSSYNGLVAKVLVAQVYYEEGLIEDCLHILDAFYNEIRAFLLNGHVDEEGISSLYLAYASVVECLGGAPLPEIP